MAVYKQKKDGAPELVSKGRSLGEQIEAVKTIKAKAGLPVTDCIKDNMVGKTKLTEAK